MIKIMRYTTLVVSLVLAAVCTGCHHSDDPCAPVAPAPDTPDPELLTLCLDIAFDGQTSAATRADKGDSDGYEGAEWDFEKIRSLRVIIVRKEKGLIEANRLVSTSAQGIPMYDNLEFKVVGNEEKRIYLIANESSLSAPVGMQGTASSFLDSFKVGEGFGYDLGDSPLDNWTVAIPDPAPDTEYVTEGLFSNARAGIDLLPLTEFFDINAERQDLELDNIYYSHLFLTRTAAKASFYLDTSAIEGEGVVDFDKVRITEISLAGIGAMEYVFPKDTEYSSPKYPDESNLIFSQNPDVSWDWNDDTKGIYVKSFSTPSEKTLTYVAKGLDVSLAKREGDPVRITPDPIYFPESILQAGAKYTVGVTLSSGARLTAPLEDNILNIGGRDAIARNTHLQVVIKFVGRTLECEARVAPYIGVTLEPLFGYDDIIVKPPKPREKNPDETL